MQGLQGPQGPRGLAAGYYRSLISSSIGTTPLTLLSAGVTGSVAYVANAKVNVPFGNNAKTVTCTLEAAENGGSTVVDRVDHLLIGSATTTAKGVIALEGLYSAAGGRTANVTVNVNCFAGGDSRTITNGSLNVIGLDSAN